MKKLVFILLSAISTIGAQAQEVYSSSGRPVEEVREDSKEREKGFDPSRVIFGGGAIFGIGGGFTNLGVTPIVGYRITDNFSAGIGLGYSYFKQKNIYVGTDPIYGDIFADFQSSTYTGSIWARHIIFRNVFAHVEPELVSLDNPIGATRDALGRATILKERVLVPRMLLGGGLRQPMSDRVSFVIVVLYDVLQDPKSPYNPLDIRVGVNVGF